jgi:hypothetical protein
MGYRFQNSIYRNTYSLPIPHIVLIAFFCFILFTAALETASAQDTVTGAFQGDVSNSRTATRIAGARVQITNVETGFV